MVDKCQNFADNHLRGINTTRCQNEDFLVRRLGYIGLLLLWNTIRIFALPVYVVLYYGLYFVRNTNSTHVKDIQSFPINA